MTLLPPDHRQPSYTRVRMEVLDSGTEIFYKMANIMIEIETISFGVSMLTIDR